MDLLKDLYNKIDSGDYQSEDIINSELIKISKIFFKEDKIELFSLAELERCAFCIQKSFDYKKDIEGGKLNGLSYKLSGVNTFEDGREEPYFWPNVIELNQFEFDFFEKRYLECNNLFAKTEYGLLVYFGSRTSYSKNKKFKKNLCCDLFQLSKEYLDKHNATPEKSKFGFSFLHKLTIAFKIAIKDKLSDEIDSIIDFIVDIHANWNLNNGLTLRVLLDLSRLLSDNYIICKTKVDFTRIILKNNEGAQVIRQSYINGALYCININLEIAQKIKMDSNNLTRRKAELYEDLAGEAEKTKNMSCVIFLEDALRLYKTLNDSIKIKELEEQYTKLRGSFPLQKHILELPGEYLEDIQIAITKSVEDSNENSILQLFIDTPWYEKIEKLKKNAIEIKNRSFLNSIMSKRIIDKLGNTVAIFQTESELRTYNFWEAYRFSYLFGTDVMQQLFLEGFKSGKITYESVIKYLNITWYNLPIKRNYQGPIKEIKPIDVIEPVIALLFRELDYFSNDESYVVDYMTITDSIVVKVEALLRFYCEKKGITTFKPRLKSKNKLVMEKLLDDLLADVEHRDNNQTFFDENDRLLIKYVLTEKVGLNLRNNVAHGLMDKYDYTFQNIIVVLCLILKISKYKFE